MTTRTRAGWVLWGLAGTLLAGGGGRAARPAAAQAAPRATYDFEDGTQGFAALSFKDGQLGADADSKVEVAKDKALVKGGAGSLTYSYKIESKVFRALAADAKVPAGTQSVRFWVRSSARTQLIFTLRETGGASYQFSFYVPASEWVPVAANLNEFVLGDGADANGKLDLDQVSSIGFYDIASMLAGSSDDILKALPNLQGPRALWLDDLQFSSTAVAQASGPAKTDTGSAYVVDNFENGVVSWVPIRVAFAATPPVFDIFPADVTLKVLPEAAGPGMARTPVEPGGKGLRWTYKRGAQEVMALNRSLEKADLRRAERLRISVNCSAPTLLVVQVKEKDGSEYNSMVMPENSVGWQTLNLALSDFTLSQDSKDENNVLDADQIKEITLLDGSAFANLPPGDKTIELDAVSFTLK